MPVLSGWCRLIAAALCLVVSAEPAGAVSPNQLELAITASYLTKFGPFVQWPPNALGSDSQPLRICVVGNDPFGNLLESAADGQRVQSHQLAVARMEAVDARTASGCQIMYVGRPTGQATATTLQVAASLPILTVTDRTRGVAGGMIEFVLDHGRVRFDVDTGAADRAGLQISSKLLALAVAVRR